MRQKGFTLVELLVVLAVGSVILVGALLTIHQVILSTGRTNSQVVALTEVNRAALRIKKDLMMTQNSNLDAVPQSSVSLSWIDYTNFGSENATSFHSSGYDLSGTHLVRTYDSKESIVGRNITSVNFTQDGRVVNVVITATGSSVPQRSETLEFSSYLRAAEIE